MYRQAVVFFLLLKTIQLVGSEPVCSQYHYEEKTLEKMIRQEHVVEKMKSEIEDIKHQVLESLKDIRDERSKVAVELEKNTRDIETIKVDVDKAVRDFETRNEENTKATATLIDSIKVAKPLVAFRAQKATDKSLSDGKIVIFTQNLLNIGEGYNNKTGIFVAPVAGVYLFTTNICVANGDWAYFGIYANDRLLSSREAGDRDWGQCSHFDAISAVVEGEHVIVKCVSECHSSDNLWENSIVINSFSGVLLKSISS